MTVKMLTAWNGYPKDYIGAVISTSEEARLVGIGFASYDLDGVDNDGVDFDVRGKRNPLTGGIELTAGGEVIEVGGGGASELPYDTVSLTATTAAIRSAPCQVAGLSCSASTSLNVRVYANSANSGTVIWEGALTAGQVVTLPAPYSSFIGLSAQIVSGSGTFAIYVR